MSAFSNLLSSRGIAQIGNSTSISDSTAVGRAVLTAVDSNAQLSVISKSLLSVTGTTLSLAGSLAVSTALTVPTPAAADNSTNAASTAFVTTALASFGGQTPIGGIIHYFGNTSDIPANWKICDGSTATIRGSTVTLPDLRDKFVTGVSSTKALGTTGGAASSTPTIAGTALTTDQLPAHNHGVSDPGHAHSVYDPGHAHGVADGGHSHGYGSQSGTQGSNGNPDFVARGIQTNAYGVRNTAASGAGIGIYGAGTGISIYGAATGISIANTGSGNTHTHTSSAVPTIPPFVALMFIIRIS